VGTIEAQAGTIEELESVIKEQAAERGKQAQQIGLEAQLAEKDAALQEALRRLAVLEETAEARLILVTDSGQLCCTRVR
jgi:tRNA/tmRNA/rRNA uracil-C5-methylase (TrmA/RlmC/RlmD family)